MVESDYFKYHIISDVRVTGPLDYHYMGLMKQIHQNCMNYLQNQKANVFFVTFKNDELIINITRDDVFEIIFNYGEIKIVFEYVIKNHASKTFILSCFKKIILSDSEFHELIHRSFNILYHNYQYSIDVKYLNTFDCLMYESGYMIEHFMKTATDKSYYRNVNFSYDSEISQAPYLMAIDIKDIYYLKRSNGLGIGKHAHSASKFKYQSIEIHKPIKTHITVSDGQGILSDVNGFVQEIRFERTT